MEADNNKTCMLLNEATNKVIYFSESTLGVCDNNDDSKTRDSMLWKIQDDGTGLYNIVNNVGGVSLYYLAVQGETVCVVDVPEPKVVSWDLLPSNGSYFVANHGMFLGTDGTEVTCLGGLGNQTWRFVECPSAQDIPKAIPTAASDQIRILHLSDTHNLHHTIEFHFPMPTADILLHTGDFSNSGSEREVESFNAWLGMLKSRYPRIFVITGNHDNKYFKLPEMKELITNATLLQNEEVNVMGLRIFGSSWVKTQPAGNPDKDPYIKQRFAEIPEGIDILMTHGPPDDIFDRIDKTSYWGSSALLRAEIERKKPKVHLFGHLHEQRGMWYRGGLDEEWKGGIEYSAWPYSCTAPPSSYPCQLISNNAMKNHPAWDNEKSCIYGPARLILASKDASGNWMFAPNI